MTQSFNFQRPKPPLSAADDDETLKRLQAIAGPTPAATTAAAPPDTTTAARPPPGVRSAPAPGAPTPQEVTAPTVTPPPGSSFIAGDPTPPNNPDLDPATGQPRQITPGVGPNGQPTSIIRNSDGSAVVTQNGQIVQRIDANGQVTTGAPAPAGAGAGGAGIDTGFKDLQGNSISADWKIDPARPYGANIVNVKTGEVSTWGALPGNAIVANPQGGFSDSQGRMYNGAGVLGSPSTDAGSQPAQNAALNNSQLVTRVQNQTVGDIARTSEAGAIGQRDLRTSAAATQATGNQIYDAAQQARLEAIARGDAGLETSLAQGRAAEDAASAVAAPLAGLGNQDQQNAAISRDAAANYAAKTGVSIAQASTAIQTLQQQAAAGDPEAIATLRSFTGNAGTAPALAAFNPSTQFNDKLEGFTGNAGNAPVLEGLNTGVSATGNLLGFTGSRGTADTLASMPTGVAGTRDLANFEGEGGVGLDELERIARGADVGPSAAEALLRKASDATTASNIAIARSGRGAGDNASALRQALFSNAAEHQQLGNDVAKIRAEEAATARGQNIGAATAAAGTRASLSGQKAQTLTAVQEGQLQAEQDRLNALVASGQMSQKQADQQLDSFKSAQTGQLASVAQKSTNLATAGEQRQTQAGQQLSAQQTAATNQINAERQRLDALVASGQMTQAQAQMQLSALQSALQGETAAAANRTTAATAAAGAANTSAGINADLTKTFADLGLQYDTASGNVFNQAGQLVMTGQQVKESLTQTGLSNQAQQGANAANITQAGTQALTQLTQTSSDAQKAAALLGPATAAQITSLSQGELAQLQQIVQSQNAEDLQKWATDKGIALQVSAQNAQQTAAYVGAVGTILTGLALLSDVRAKTDIEPISVGDWMAQTGLNAPAAAHADPKAQALSAQQKLALINMGGKLGNQIGTAIGSDERGKRDLNHDRFDELLDRLEKIVSPERHDTVDVRAAKGYAYNYKDPSAPGAAPGRQYGPMAQDLLKTSARDAVGKGPGGKLFVDPVRAGMTALAGLSEQQRRIDDLEKELLRIARGRP